MADNFQDNVIFSNSTLTISGNAVQIGDGAAGAKSVVFTNNAGGLNLAGNATGNATVNLPNNNGTLLLSSQAILSISAGGNTISSGQAIFSNSNGVSFGINGQTITASHNAITSQTVQTQGVVVPSAGTQTATTGTVVWSNSNNLTFGMSGSSRITASYNFNVSGGTTSNNLNALTFADGGNVSFGLNGSTITATVPTQSNQTLGGYAVGNTTQSSSGTIDARSLSFQGAGIASVGVSNGSVVISVPTGAPSPVNFSAGTTSSNLGSVVFSNSNGVSFGLNGATITASAAGGGGGATSAGFFATGNTTQNSTTTLPISSLLFNGLGGVSAGYSNGSIQMSAPNTSSLVGVGGVVMSTNGSTISVGMATADFFEPYQLNAPNLQSGFVPGLASLYFQPFLLNLPISGGRINVIHNFSVSFQVTNGNTFATGTTGSAAAQFGFTKSAALYSQGSGTNSTRLESMWSNTWSYGISRTLSASSAAGTTMRATNAITLSYIQSIGTDGNYTTNSITGSATSSSGASSLATNNFTSIMSSIRDMLSSIVVVPIGLNTSISAGNYWLMQAYSSSSATTNTAIASLISFSQQFVISGLSTQPRLWGNTVTTSSSQMIPGQGVFSAASASPPSTVAFADIRSVASNPIYYFNIINSNV